MRKVLIALLFVSTTANAAFRDGNELLSELNSSKNSDVFYSMGYIAGVADAMHGVTHCAPSNATLGQMMDMTIDYLTRNPSVRNLSADLLISAMLSERWPCPKKGKGV